MKSLHTLAVSVLILSVAVSAQAANSVTVVPGSLTQGAVQTNMGAGTNYALETNNLSDWLLTTGSFMGSANAISLTNDNFYNPSFGGSVNSIIAFGNGGGITLKFDAPIYPVDGEKEFGIFTAQKVLASSGAIFNGNMEAAILVSRNGTDWFTLSGVAVSDYLTYTDTSRKLNAPAMAYQYGTTKKAWDYGSPGTTTANLNALTVADYQIPMPDAGDNLFNGTGTNADRYALRLDTTEATYDMYFGTSGGGNWFDISDCGFPEVNYIRLNGVNCAESASLGGIRLDAVFSTVAATVPEPATLTLLAPSAVGLIVRKKRRTA